MIRFAPARDLFDRLAIGVSALCLAHCAASVVLVTMLATAIHEMGLALAIVLAIAGLGRGYLQHRRRVPMILGTAGIALMATALSVPHGLLEAGLTMLGVCGVATAHLLNGRAHS